MNKFHAVPMLLALSLAPFVAGCSSRDAGAATDAVAGATAEATKATSAIGRQVEQEIAKARAELRTKDISLNHGNIGFGGKHRRGSGDRGPDAAITPAGDLVVDGKTVAVTPAQRAMLLDYRGQLVGIAESGMAIGAKGADLAGAAVTEALGAVFGGGDKDRMKQRIEARAESLKQEAMQICGRLPALLEAQHKLADSLPEFKPYANMTREDVDDCSSDIDNDGAWSDDDDGDEGEGA